MTQQLKFNWTYLQRKEWIDEARLPKGRARDGSGVSATTMRQVLHRINDHLGDNPDAWPGQDRIAELMSVSKRTVIRATQALVSLSLLIIEPEPLPRGGHRNRYRIVWTELQLLEESRRQAWASFLARQQGDITTNHGDMVTEQGDITTNHGDTMSPEQLTNNSTNNPKNNPPLQVTAKQAIASRDEMSRGVPISWQVVVSALGACGMGDTRGAVTAAKRRELAASEVLDLVERWKRLKAHQSGVTVGWLYRWITGKTKPPSVDDVNRPRIPPGSLTSERTRRELLRTKVFQRAMKEGKPRDECERLADEAFSAGAIVKAVPQQTKDCDQRRQEVLAELSKLE